MIEELTHPKARQLNRQLLAQLAALINADDGARRDAAKALAVKCDDWDTGSQLLSLLCLEYLIKACGPDFHDHLAAKAVPQILSKVAVREHATPPAVRQKAEDLLQQFAFSVLLPAEPQEGSGGVQVVGSMFRASARGDEEPGRGRSPRAAYGTANGPSRKTKKQGNLVLDNRFYNEEAD